MRVDWSSRIVQTKKREITPGVSLRFEQMETIVCSKIRKTTGNHCKEKRPDSGHTTGSHTHYKCLREVTNYIRGMFPSGPLIAPKSLIFSPLVIKCLAPPQLIKFLKEEFFTCKNLNHVVDHLSAS